MQRIPPKRDRGSIVIVQHVLEFVVPHRLLGELIIGRLLLFLFEFDIDKNVEVLHAHEYADCFGKRRFSREIASGDGRPSDKVGTVNPLSAIPLEVGSSDTARPFGA